MESRTPIQNLKKIIPNLFEFDGLTPELVEALEIPPETQLTLTQAWQSWCRHALMLTSASKAHLEAELLAHIAHHWDQTAPDNPEFEPGILALWCQTFDWNDQKTQIESILGRDRFAPFVLLIDGDVLPNQEPNATREPMASRPWHLLLVIPLVVALILWGLIRFALNLSEAVEKTDNSLIPRTDPIYTDTVIVPNLEPSLMPNHGSLSALAFSDLQNLDALWIGFCQTTPGIARDTTGRPVLDATTGTQTGTEFCYLALNLGPPIDGAAAQANSNRPWHLPRTNALVHRSSFAAQGMVRSQRVNLLLGDAHFVWRIYPDGSLGETNMGAISVWLGLDTSTLSDLGTDQLAMLNDFRDVFAPSAEHFQTHDIICLPQEITPTFDVPLPHDMVQYGTGGVLPYQPLAIQTPDGSDTSALEAWWSHAVSQPLALHEIGLRSLRVCWPVPKDGPADMANRLLEGMRAFDDLTPNAQPTFAQAIENLDTLTPNGILSLAPCWSPRMQKETLDQNQWSRSVGRLSYVLSERMCRVP